MKAELMTEKGSGGKTPVHHMIPTEVGIPMETCHLSIANTGIVMTSDWQVWCRAKRKDTSKGRGKHVCIV